MSFLTTLPRERYNASAFNEFNAESGDYNPGTAKAMAWACQLAYETADPRKVASIAASWSCDIPEGGIISENSATILPTSSTQLIVFLHGGAVIISFAGTDPLTLTDWITDFDVGSTNEGAANGFAVAAQSVFLRIENLLQNPSIANKPIFVTGHSLGASLAALTAQKIHAIRPGSVKAVYTYGMPRTGNEQFASAYNQTLGSRTYRLVHGDDVVAKVPPSSLLKSRHVGRFLHCVRLGKFDASALAPTTASDQPEFAQGISAQLKRMHLGPLSGIMSLAARLKLAAALISGKGPSGLRTDPGGIVIELLPPPLRDHMPDRYIGGF